MNNKKDIYLVAEINVNEHTKEEVIRFFKNCIGVLEDGTSGVIGGGDCKMHFYKESKIKKGLDCFDTELNPYE